MVKKKLEDLERNPMQSETIKDWAMEIMQYIFTRSQENLNIPLEWGDTKKPSSRKPTTITDMGFLMRSGIPPYLNEAEKQIELVYDCPYALFIEYGTDPHPIPVKHLISWVKRKLKIKGKKALGVAYAIAYQIKTEGSYPHPFLRPAIHDAIAKFDLKIKGPDI